jgi:uncharacterized protein (DUF2236 family)
MASRVLPSEAELPGLLPTPESVLWRRGGDARTLMTAGYALILQVAHPTVGAGVSEHSNYVADPWGRLLRTLDYVYVMVYGGPRVAGEVGRRVREMHKQIKGVAPDGTRYHALEPEAYAWVHATLIDAIVAGNQRFARPLRREQIERIYAEWRSLGRVIGVREEDLPDSWAEFRRYFDLMVADRLEDTQAVHDVLATVTNAVRPPLPRLPQSAWRAARFPASRLFDLATAGMLPPVLRERFGLPWTRAQELEFRALARASRAATPVMPERLRVIGPAYLRLRREAIARGDVAAAGA